MAATLQLTTRQIRIRSPIATEPRNGRQYPEAFVTVPEGRVVDRRGAIVGAALSDVGRVDDSGAMDTLEDLGRA